MCHLISSNSLCRGVLEPFCYARDFARETSKYERVFQETIEQSIPVENPRLKKERFKHGLAAICLSVPFINVVVLTFLNRVGLTKRVVLSKLAKALEDPRYQGLKFESHKNLIKEDRRGQIDCYDSLIQDLEGTLDDLNEKGSSSEISSFSNKLERSARSFVEKQFYQELDYLEEEEKKKLIRAMSPGIVQIVDKAQRILFIYGDAGRCLNNFFADFEIENVSFSDIKDYLVRNLIDSELIPRQLLDQLILKRMIFYLENTTKTAHKNPYLNRKLECFQGNAVESANNKFQEALSDHTQVRPLFKTLKQMRSFIFAIFDCEQINFSEEETKQIKDMVIPGFSALEKKSLELAKEIDEISRFIDHYRPDQTHSDLMRAVQKKNLQRHLTRKGLRSLIDQKLGITPNKSSIQGKSLGSGSSPLLRSVLSSRLPRRKSYSSSSSSDRSVSFSDSSLFRQESLDGDDC